MKKICPICKNEFEKTKTESVNYWLNKRKVCSLKCKKVWISQVNKKIGLRPPVWQKGKARPEMSALIKGQWASGKRKGGWKHSEETRRKMSETCKGENNACWRGGVSLNLGYRNFYIRRRKARLRGATGSHSRKEWEDLKKFYDYMCLCCKKTEPEIKLTEDHIIPISKGGSNYIDNIQPLCVSCNQIKHTKIISYIPEKEMGVV